MPVPAIADGALVGRAAQLDRATELLRRHRLVTLTGVGGVGKTSLASVLVDRQVSAGHRAAVCTLAELDTGDAVRHHVAEALGADDRMAVLPGAPGETVLLLIDNCEHVLDAAAAVAEEVLRAGPHVRVLTTSREPLGVAGERVLALGPLTVPRAADEPDAATTDAVQLFVRRAQSVDDTFRLDATTLPAVAEICRALDGLPLALEIAAARVRSMTVRDLADRLGERFTLLTDRRRRGPARHRDLRSVVAWSYELLEPQHRAVFERLAVHPSCDVDAAVAAASSVGVPDHEAFGVLDDLVAKSLLVADTATGRTRYRLLHTLRAFGMERLTQRGALATAKDRHADYYADLADGLRTLGRTSWTVRLAALMTELDNTRAALHWTLQEDTTPERSYRLLAPLWYVGLQSHAAEIAELAGRLLGRWPADDHPLRAEVQATGATCLLALEDWDGAAELAEAAIAAGTSPVATAWASATLAGIAMHAHDRPDRALVLLDQADVAAGAAGFEPFRCDLLGRRTAVLVQAGRDADALDNARRAVELAATQGNDFEHAWALHLVGKVLAREDPPAGRECLRHALDESVRIGYPYGTAASTRALGVVAAESGDLSTASDLLDKALDGFLRTGFRLERWNTLAATLPLLRRTGQQALAAEVAVAIKHSGVVIERINAPAYDPAEAEHLSPSAPPASDLDGLLDRLRSALRTTAAGHPDVVDEAAALQAQRTAPTGTLRRTGPLWEATYGGRTVHLPALKGVGDLAALLRRPGAEIPALDLAAGGPPGLQAGDLGELVDHQARAAYAARVRQLQVELDDSTSAGDAHSAARAQAELDALTAQLSAAYGLHGPRRTGDPAEKARSTVTARVRSAIAQIARVHPELGRHLDRSVRTGRFCVYLPEQPTSWQVEP